MNFNTSFLQCINFNTVILPRMNFYTVSEKCIDFLTLAIFAFPASEELKVSRATLLNCISSCLACSLVPSVTSFADFLGTAGIAHSAGSVLM